jgi:hypothetical protein
MNKRTRNIAIILVIIAVVILVWYFYTKGNLLGLNSDAPLPIEEDGDEWFYFRTLGGSSLLGTDCGEPGNIFTGAGGTAASDMYVTLQLGTPEQVSTGEVPSGGNANCWASPLDCFIVPGMQILVEMFEGYSSLDGNLYDILQIGTDTCTANGEQSFKRDGVIINELRIQEGWTAAEYEASPDYNQGGWGRFKIINN